MERQRERHKRRETGLRKRARHIGRQIERKKERRQMERYREEEQSGEGIERRDAGIEERHGGRTEGKR